MTAASVIDWEVLPDVGSADVTLWTRGGGFQHVRVVGSWNACAIRDLTRALWMLGCSRTRRMDDSLGTLADAVEAIMRGSRFERGRF